MRYAVRRSVNISAPSVRIVNSGSFHPHRCLPTLVCPRKNARIVSARDFLAATAKYIECGKTKYLENQYWAVLWMLEPTHTFLGIRPRFAVAPRNARKVNALWLTINRCFSPVSSSDLVTAHATMRKSSGWEPPYFLLAARAGMRGQFCSVLGHLRQQHEQAPMLLRVSRNGPIVAPLSSTGRLKAAGCRFYSVVGGASSPAGSARSPKQDSADCDTSGAAEINSWPGREAPVAHDMISLNGDKSSRNNHRSPSDEMSPKAAGQLNPLESSVMDDDDSAREHEDDDDDGDEDKALGGREGSGPADGDEGDQREDEVDVDVEVAVTRRKRKERKDSVTETIVKGDPRIFPGACIWW